MFHLGLMKQFYRFLILGACAQANKALETYPVASILDHGSWWLKGQPLEYGRWAGKSFQEGHRADEGLEK